MKKVLFLACVAVLIGGCGYSNWNVFGEPNSQSTTRTDTTMPTQEPTRPEDTMQDGQTIVGEPIAMSGEEIQMQQPQDRENMFHINTVVSTWGKPDSARIDDDNVRHYIWRNCKNTGHYREQCVEDNCRQVPVQNCCDRDLITDDEGYVINLKEAVSKCL